MTSLLSRVALFFLLSVPLLAQPDYELSYLLVRSSDGRILAHQEEEKLRIPASTMKVLTAAAALQTLGPEHVYRTTVLAAVHPHRGRLRGDLYLKGDADPELTQQDLESLACQLHDLGLRRVQGDLVVDEGPYASPPYGAGWAWDDAGSEDSPEVTGLAVDEGMVATPPGFNAPWLSMQSGPDSAVLLVPGREGVLVQGELPERLAPPRSSLRTGQMFGEHLKRHGIRISGMVRLGASRGEELAAHQSRPLAEIMKRALAISDNLAMELVYRSCGAALPRCLQDERLRRVDGCGLSRYNLLSARQLVTVLRAEPRLRHLIPAGGEGTLKNRFLKGAAAAHVAAKTGTLSNVSALAGYLYPETPQECVFAIMINGHLGSTAARKGIEDGLVEGWAEQYGPRPQAWACSIFR
jgi:D-alanyl-D-alanine carboxypeptidase/D-alanyl-D-alanine-endopeptidase (penicillin-binding protein 4)